MKIELSLATRIDFNRGFSAGSSIIPQIDGVEFTNKKGCGSTCIIEGRRIPSDEIARFPFNCGTIRSAEFKKEVLGLIGKQPDWSLKELLKHLGDEQFNLKNPSEPILWLAEKFLDEKGLKLFMLDCLEIGMELCGLSQQAFNGLRTSNALALGMVQAQRRQLNGSQENVSEYIVAFDKHQTWTFDYWSSNGDYKEIFMAARGIVSAINNGKTPGIRDLAYYAVVAGTLIIDGHRRDDNVLATGRVQDFIAEHYPSYDNEGIRQWNARFYTLNGECVATV